MVTLLILWLLYSIAEGYEDANYNPFKDHRPTLYNRLVVGSMILFMGYRFDLGWVWLGCTAYVMLSVFWFTFDAARNLFDGARFFYVGGTSAIDRWGNDYLMIYWCMKFFMLLTSIGLFIQYNL